MTASSTPQPDLNRLTAIFKALGAKDPEDWARSQMKEGIPQLARFMALKDAWMNVEPESSDSWMRNLIASFRYDPQGPYAGAGAAVERLLKAGASKVDLSEVVRAVQAQMLFNLLYTFTASDYPREKIPELGNIAWALMAVDRDSGKPLYEVESLHESVLETDPTGREMRPKSYKGS